jgi:hypothetical protein
MQLALLFDPKAQVDRAHCLDALRTVDFKMISKGHPKRLDHFWITMEVEQLAQSKGKQKAIEAVAEKLHMSLRQVQRICRKAALGTFDDLMT